jgi:hypothetical protein
MSCDEAGIIPTESKGRIATVTNKNFFIGSSETFLCFELTQVQINCSAFDNFRPTARRVRNSRVSKHEWTFM